MEVPSPHDRLTNLSWTGTGGTIASFSYEYDRVDNRTSMTLDHLGARFDYRYNGVYWLTGETSGGVPTYENRFVNIPGGNESPFSDEVKATPRQEQLAVPAYTYEWEYDACGNRTAKRCLGGEPLFGQQSDYTYDDENRLTVESTNQGDIVYEYDQNGNTISKTQGGQEERYYYDYANRMNAYRNASGQTWTYQFAPSGERLAKLNPDGTEEWFAYDGPDVIADYSRAGGNLNWESSYVQGLGMDSKIARITTINSLPTTLYYVGDALNSVHKVVDGNQSTVNTTVNNAWGEEIVDSQSLPDRHGFTQREKDGESALQYSRARMYDPRMGRCFSKDRFSTRSISSYVYARNNPVLLVDPYGLKETAILGVEGGVAWGQVQEQKLRDIYLGTSTDKPYLSAKTFIDLYVNGKQLKSGVIGYTIDHDEFGPIVRVYSSMPDGTAENWTFHTARGKFKGQTWAELMEKLKDKKEHNTRQFRAFEYAFAYLFQGPGYVISVEAAISSYMQSNGLSYESFISSGLDGYFRRMLGIRDQREDHVLKSGDFQEEARVGDAPYTDVLSNMSAYKIWENRILTLRRGEPLPRTEPKRPAEHSGCFVGTVSER